MIEEVAKALRAYNQEIQKLNENPSSSSYTNNAKMAKEKFEERILLIVEERWKVIPNE